MKLFAFVVTVFSCLSCGRTALHLSVVSAAVVVGIFFYLSVWLSLVMKNNVPWDIECPNMIPIATGSGVLSFVSFIVTMWPVWGLLSPLLVTFLLLGLIFVTHFIPWPCSSSSSWSSSSSTSSSSNQSSGSA
jgi:hypothetical protein